MNKPLLFILLTMIYSCSQDNIFNGKLVEVSDISSFQCKGDTVYTGMGISTIDLTSKYVLLSRYKIDHFLTVLDINSFEIKEELCIKGNGHGEFLSLRVLNKLQLPEHLMVRDYYKNELTSINIDLSVERGKTITSPVINFSNNGSFLEVFYHEGNTVIKNHNTENNSITYSVNYKEVFNMYNTPITLNDANYIMTIADGYEVNTNKIVSLNGSNQIDVIDLDNPENSLSIISKGSKTWGINRFLESNSNGFYLTLPRLSENYIVALYKNIDRYEFHITNWNGDFIRKIVVNDNIRDFNVRWETGEIYGISSDEYIIVYDISSFITKS